MNDPHVEWLEYKIVCDSSTSFDAPALKWQQDGANISVEDDVIRVEPMAHFASESEATDVMDDLLATWVVHSALERLRQEFTVEFVDSNIVDRTPPKKGENQVVMAGCATAKFVILPVTLHLKHNRYPDPPKAGFVLTPGLKALWERYQQYQSGREPLQGMANFVLTSLEATISQTQSKTRDDCAKALNVEFAVLHKLGGLLASRGTDLTVRKYDKKNQPQPFVGQEERWVIEVIPKLIRHAGHFYGGSATQLSQLTLKDLPAL